MLYLFECCVIGDGLCGTAGGEVTGEIPFRPFSLPKGRCGDEEWDGIASGGVEVPFPYKELTVEDDFVVGIVPLES